MKSIFISLFFISILSLSTAAHSATENISKQQAVEIATQKYPGRVLSVKRKTKTYKVKILNKKGQVRTIRVDAKKGKIKSGNKIKQHR